MIVGACKELDVEGNQGKNKRRSWETCRDYYTMPKTNQLDALSSFVSLNGGIDGRQSRCYLPSVGVGMGVGSSQVERSVGFDSKSATIA